MHHSFQPTPESLETLTWGKRMCCWLTALPANLCLVLSCWGKCYSSLMIMGRVATIFYDNPVLHSKCLLEVWVRQPEASGGSLGTN